MGSHPVSAIGNDPHRTGQLNGGHPNPLTDRNIGNAGARPPLRRNNDSGDLSRKVDSCFSAESEGNDIVMEPLTAEFLRNLHRPDIARFCNHFPEG